MFNGWTQSIVIFVSVVGLWAICFGLMYLVALLKKRRNSVRDKE